MKYVHPDVLDNGPAHLRASATRALLLPDFSQSTTYAQAIASAIMNVPISSTDFVLANEATGRKVIFNGVVGVAGATIDAGAPLHIALVDSTSRILLVNNESSRVAIGTGNRYKIPPITYVNPQPE
jgi:hypothetical protein